MLELSNFSPISEYKYISFSLALPIQSYKPSFPGTLPLKLLSKYCCQPLFLPLLPLFDLP